MLTSQQTNDIFGEETAEQKQARLNRLRVAEIKRELKHIDNDRIRPLAAIATGTATDYDTNKLKQLEQEAQNLRAELAELNTVVIEDEQESEAGSTAIPE